MNDPIRKTPGAPRVPSTGNRRLAYIECSLDLLTGALFPTDTAGLQKIISTDLPPDARILRVRQDWDDELAGRVKLLVASDEFPEVDEGALIPQRLVTISCETIDCEPSVP